MEWWSELDEKVITDTGFVAGKDNVDALRNLMAYYTDPKEGDKNVIAYTISEVDSFYHGILLDSDIHEIYLEEKNNGIK
jgi:hypothetical protein